MVTTGSNRAVFLDRDGVVNENLVRDRRPYAPTRFEEFHLLPGVEEAIRRLKNAGYFVVIVTNQPDVPNGITQKETVEAIHAEIRKQIGRAHV